jgi:hypothetical protein
MFPFSKKINNSAPRVQAFRRALRGASESEVVRSLKCSTSSAVHQTYLVVNPIPLSCLQLWSSS